MSRIVAPSGDAVVIPPRKMTPARRKRLLEAAGGVCARLGCEVTEGLELDHIIPLELSGDDSDAAFEPLCPAHHKAKTRLDVKMIAKARRIRKRLSGEKKPKGLIKSRGFQKGSKRPIPSRPLRS